MTRHRPMVHKAAWMIAARVVGLGFGALGAAWSARCLGPTNLGISGMVQNLVVQATILMAVFSPTVLIREYKNLESDAERNHLVRITCGFRLLLAAFLSLVAALILAFHWVPAAYGLVGWLFIPNILAVSVQPVWILQATEKQQFQSMIAVLQPTLTALVYFFFFKPGMSAGADLAVITMVSLFLLIVYWMAVYRLTPMRGELISFRGLERARELAWRSRWFCVSALVMYVYTLLEQPLLGWLCSADELGKYRTAVRVTDALSGTLAIVPVLLFPRFIEWRRQGEAVLRQRQKKLVALFAFSGTLASAAGFILVPWVYPFVFGDAFAQAGFPCAILVLSKLVTVISGLYAWGLLTDHRYDKSVTLLQVAAAVVSLGLNLVLIPRFKMYGAACVNLTSEVIVLASFIWLSARRYRSIQEAA